MSQTHYSVYLLIACFAAALAYIWHRGWMPPIGKSKTPVADVIFIGLLAFSGRPADRLFGGLGVRLQTVSLLLAVALLFFVAYGWAFFKSDHRERMELSRRFACTMISSYLIFVVVNAALL